MSITPKSWIRIEWALGLALLIGAWGWHARTASIGWATPTLTGNAFRQLQTGQATQFIVFEDNYALAYPTPILGKPWSIPMEFPLYQWTVAKLHQLSGIPLTECARGVSLISFYATLPAFFLLLLTAGVPARRAPWALVPLLMAPVTILYSRAFLIDTMALCLAGWFLYFFVRLIRTPSLRWWWPTALLGALAGATKATTLIGAVFACLILALHAVGRRWQKRDEPHGKAELKSLLAWGASSAVLPLLATWSWTRFADATKALNPVGAALTSDKLVRFNFGDDLLADRFSLNRWQALAAQWETGLGPWWLIVASPLVVWFGAGRFRRPAMICLGVFFGCQLLMPNLFSIHDYYFVGIAGALTLAWGLTAAGLVERGRGGIGVAIGLLLTIASFQVATFRANYLDGMQASSGGNDLSHQLYMLTEEDEVIIIAGSEWHAFVPYYAKRRALMLPFGTQDDLEIREKAFDLLDRDEVAALVLTHKSRNHEGLIKAAREHFGVSEYPLLKFDDADVFFTERVMAELLPTEGQGQNSGGAPMQVYADSMTKRVVATDNLSRRQKRLFANISPHPARFFFEFGPAVLNTPEGLLINAHTTTEMWFELPPGPHRLAIDYGMFDTVWQEAHMVSDGVELQIDLLRHNDTEESLFRHYLHPRERTEDRGPHTAEIEFEVPAGAEVRLRSHPGPHNQTPFDWFYLKQVRIDAID